jgi:hypothetical protein
VDTGKFEIIKDSGREPHRRPRLQAMFIAFSFGAFIEGAAGFGAPVAVRGAMLAGSASIRFSPPASACWRTRRRSRSGRSASRTIRCQRHRLPVAGRSAPWWAGFAR